MSNIVKIEANKSLASMSEHEVLSVLKSSLYPGASDGSVKMVLAYCQASGLDPMQKPVHIVPIWDSRAAQMRDVVMPGIGLYRTQASRTGQFAGMSEPEYGPDVVTEIGNQKITYPEWCKVTVKRQLESGVLAEFTAKEFWIENYAVKGGKDKSIAPNAMWTKRPRGQITKCAEAQALRKAFPELGAAPTADEMEGKEIDMGPVERVPEVKPEPAKTLPSITLEMLTKNFPVWKKFITDGGTIDNVIIKAKSRWTLTDEQIAMIKDIGKPKEDPINFDVKTGEIVDAEWVSEFEGEQK